MYLIEEKKLREYNFSKIFTLKKVEEKKYLNDIEANYVKSPTKTLSIENLRFTFLVEI
jgi:hypothetical protein